MNETTASTVSTADVSAKKLTPVEVLDQQIADLQRRRDAVKSTEDFKSHFVNSEGDAHEDQHAIDGAFLRAAGGAMEARLRAGNFTSWHDTPTDDITARAAKELAAGNYIDAAILALFAQAHQSIAA